MDVYKPYWHVSWCSLYKVYMMFGYSHCNTDELHFKVPVFWEILPLSEQNRMNDKDTVSKYKILNHEYI